MKTIGLITMIIGGFLVRTGDDDLLGQWQTHLGDLLVTMLYKKDSTFDVLVNRKVFASGRYTYTGNTITFVEDNGCISSNGAQLKGVYRITHVAADSIQFSLVWDSCSKRRGDLDHLKLGKVEKASAQ